MKEFGAAAVEGAAAAQPCACAIPEANGYQHSGGGHLGAIANVPPNGPSFSHKGRDMGA